MLSQILRKQVGVFDYARAVCNACLTVRACVLHYICNGGGGAVPLLTLAFDRKLCASVCGVLKQQGLAEHRRDVAYWCVRMIRLLARIRECDARSCAAVTAAAVRRRRPSARRRVRAATLIPRMLREKDGAVVPLLAEVLLAFPDASEVVTYTAAALTAICGYRECRQSARVCVPPPPTHTH